MHQPPVELKVSAGLVPYPEAEAAMEARVAAIRAGTAPELLWFLEHPPLYTAGTSAQAGDLLTPDRFPVFQTGRGGQYTYHGPGQRVVYVMLDLKERGPDVRCFVRDLETCIIQALAAVGVTGERREGRIGIWVARTDAAGLMREDKIGAIGVRVRHWVTYHGISINVAPDLSHFTGIVPCGVTAHGVTSLKDLGVNAGLAELDAALKTAFADVFKLTLKSA
jgi:lipoyl(octanoyl) transferase